MKRKRRKTATAKSGRRPLNEKRWRNILALCALVLGLVRFVLVPFVEKSKLPGKLSETETARIIGIIDEVLRDYNIRDLWRIDRGQYEEVRLPKGINFYDLYISMQNRLHRFDASILDISASMDDLKFYLTVGKDKKIARKYIFRYYSQIPEQVGLAAVIIDDFGYSYNEVVRGFLFSRRPYTLAIIPGLAKSSRIAREADLAGKEVLVHMPMEPLSESYKVGEYTIVTGQGAGTVRLKLQRAFSSLPEAIGLNNHQGSKATADEELMRIVLMELKSQGKFFVDSYTNSKSVAYRMARELGCPSERNQVFLDVEDDENFIAERVERMAQIANERGSVIAIGHVRSRTYTVLHEKLPQLESRGIEFVPVSVLVR